MNTKESSESFDYKDESTWLMLGNCLERMKVILKQLRIGLLEVR